MLHLHFANRFETLVQRLSDRLKGSREDLFSPDTVVVPHTAAKRQLQLSLADAEGICANVAFAWLASWLWEQAARVLPGVQADSPVDAASLAWRLQALFAEPDFLEAQPVLASYLAGGEGDPLFAWELAARTGVLMEQYVTYRPDWLAAWQREQAVTRSQHEGWQAGAWRRIAADLGLGGEHPIEAMARELAQAGPDARRLFGLPASVHLFALPAIPPLYLAALQSLGRVLDVHVYALSPSPEYWFDLVDPKRLDRLRAAGKADGFEVGHQLLTSWGGQTQAALDLLTRIDESDGAAWTTDYQPSARGTLLARLQDSMLELEDLAPGSVPLAWNDRSIEVHVAHSLTRELEALHDQLLARFKADPTLRPSDVLVVTPDIDAAAPLVDAVFGTVPKSREIAYAITGRRHSGANAPARAFLALLSLAASRCTATRVFALLQQPVVARRFGLEEEGLARVHEWMVAAGIHWGLDEAHVAAQDLPITSAHTLADGLERLFLGYALPDALSHPLDGCLPLGGAEGSAAAALGSLWAFASRLRVLGTELARPRPPREWATLLRAAMDDYLEPDRDEVEDGLELLHALDGLWAAMARAGFTGDVPGPVVRAALEEALERGGQGGTPTGRVTFTGMSSLRTLPFRLVCAIGLDDGAFPTRDRSPEFDLMAAVPRAGDRQRRTDQRTLFLDLLLAARDAVYLSYTGRSIRDNSPLPPSVLVSELLDGLVPAIATDPGDAAALRAARARLVVEHPLQPFSPLAFDSHPDAEQRIRSFDAAMAQALRDALSRPRADPGDVAAIAEDGGEDTDAGQDAEPALRFFPQPLRSPGPAWQSVTVGRLVEFFRNPSRYLLRRRLRIDLPRDEPVLEDDEPLLPDLEGRWRLADRLLPELLRGADRETVRRLAQAGTELPGGALGSTEREGEIDALLRFADAVRRQRAAEPLPPSTHQVVLELEGEPWELEGSLGELRAGGLLRWRYDEERATDVLDAWIRHLLLCADTPGGVEPCTTWIGRTACTVYDPVVPWAARERLAELLALYREGLAEPLAFFPKSAWAKVCKRDPRRKWEGTERFPGERAHPAYVLAWRGVEDPWVHGFDDLADKVFGELPVRRVPLAALEPSP